MNFSEPNAIDKITTGLLCLLPLIFGLSLYWCFQLNRRLRQKHPAYLPYRFGYFLGWNSTFMGLVLLLILILNFQVLIQMEMTCPRLVYQV
ncbi:MAG: hypothetical protein ACOY3I_00435 [Verrucomicrobiota bacterium]